jgi:hypothetical protein
VQQVIVIEDEEEEEAHLGWLGTVVDDVKHALLETCRYDMLVLMTVNRAWYQYFCRQDWDTKMSRWYESSCDHRYLARLNRHFQDHHIVFTESSHSYRVIHWSRERLAFTVLKSRRINGHPDLSGLTSTTTWIGTMFPEFDADVAIQKMRQGRNWSPQHYAYNMTDEEIKAHWQKNNTEASEAGTAMHANIECYYNQEPYEPDSAEFLLFRQYEQEFVAERQLEPYRSEMMIFDTDLKISGSIDMLYRYREPTSDGLLHLVMVDWKRSKEIKQSNQYEGGLCALTERDEDCNYVHYSYQLRIYKLILERRYNVHIDAMFLAVFHPRQQKFLTYEVPCDQQKAEAIIAYRMQQLMSLAASKVSTVPPPQQSDAVHACL